jgi:hypothetical protein
VKKLLCLCGLALALFVLYEQVKQNALLGSDFAQDYSAALALRRGQSIYGPSANQIAAQELGFAWSENFHPPFISVLFVALTFFSYLSANLLWAALSLCLWFFICWGAVEELGFRKDLLYFFPLTLFWHPIVEVLSLGQSSLLIGACLAGTWLALCRKHEALAGSLLACGSLIKLFPLFLFLFLLLSRRWRALRFALLGWLLGTALCLWLVGFADFKHYFMVVIPKDLAEWAVFPPNISISGVLLPLFQSNRWSEPLLLSPRLGSCLVLAVKIAAALATLWQGHKLLKQQQETAAFMLCLVAMLLLSPITWPHMLPIMLVPLMYVFKASTATKDRLVFWCVLILFSLPTYGIGRFLRGFYPDSLMPWYVPLLVKGGFLGLMLLWVLLATPSKATLAQRRPK